MFGSNYNISIFIQAQGAKISLVCSKLRVKSRKDEKFFPKHSSSRITRGSHITYYNLMFFIAYAFKGQVHVFAGRVKIVSHSSCRTSAIFLTPIATENMGQMNMMMWRTDSKVPPKLGGQILKLLQNFNFEI